MSKYNVNVTVSEVKKVEIDSSVLISIISNVLHSEMEDIRLQNIKNEEYNFREAEYINDKGVWESWFDTGHGSGCTTTYRHASDRELEFDEWRKRVLQFLRDKL